MKEIKEDDNDMHIKVLMLVLGLFVFLLTIMLGVFIGMACVSLDDNFNENDLDNKKYITDKDTNKKYVFTDNKRFVIDEGTNKKYMLEEELSPGYVLMLSFMCIIGALIIGFFAILR